MADPDYFTLDEFRYLPEMDKEGKYGDEDVLRAAAYITAVIERVVGTSFVARTVTETVDGPCHSAELALRSPYVLALTSLSVGGTTVDTADVILKGGVVRYLAGQWWTSGVGNIVVTYQSGYSTEPPDDIKEAAMQATRARLLEKHGTARVMDRASTLANDAGGTTTFVLAGPDRPTGYPDVDSVIIGWRDKLAGFGFA